MKIVSWNCNGAFRNKFERIELLDGDVYVIQECENPVYSNNAYKDWAGENYLWIGQSKNKGIGVFPKKGNRVDQEKWFGKFAINLPTSKSASLTWNTDELKEFLPFKINNSYVVLAVWTKASKGGTFGYIGQLWKYLQIHRRDLQGNKTIIVGDFNSNKQWDSADRWWSHSDVVNELEAMGLISLYHFVFNQAQGQETSPTFFLHKKIEKSYHIDYAFLSRDLVSKSLLKIGAYENWIDQSDHMPIIVDIENQV